MKKTIFAMIAAAGLVLTGGSLAQATDTAEVWWRVPEGAALLPSDDARGDGFRVDETGFPQTYMPNGESDLQCGEYAQVDIYHASDVPNLLEDGILEYGEDWDVILNWRFVYGGDCEEIPEIPEVPDTPDNPETPDAPQTPDEDTPVAPKAPIEIQTARK